MSMWEFQPFRPTRTRELRCIVVHHQFMQLLRSPLSYRHTWRMTADVQSHAMPYRPVSATRVGPWFHAVHSKASIQLPWLLGWDVVDVHSVGVKSSSRSCYQYNISVTKQSKGGVRGGDYGCMFSLFCIGVMTVDYWLNWANQSDEGWKKWEAFHISHEGWKKWEALHINLLLYACYAPEPPVFRLTIVRMPCHEQGWIRDRDAHIDQHCIIHDGEKRNYYNIQKFQMHQ